MTDADRALSRRRPLPSGAAVFAVPREGPRSVRVAVRVTVPVPVSWSSKECAFLSASVEAEEPYSGDRAAAVDDLYAALEDKAFEKVLALMTRAESELVRKGR